jgi:hypothetical protein
VLQLVAALVLARWPAKERVEAEAGAASAGPTARGGEGGAASGGLLASVPCLHAWRRRTKRRRRELAGCAAGERRPGCARQRRERKRRAREWRERRTAWGEKAPQGTWRRA